MDEPSLYEFQIAERIGQWRAEWLGGCTVVAHGSHGETTIHGRVEDAPALYGILWKMRDLGLTLLALRKCEAGTQQGRAFGGAAGEIFQEQR